MATHFTGPVLNRDRKDGPRAWFSKLPVGYCGGEYITYFNDFLVAQDYAATDWVVTETDSSATQGIAADVVGGALALVNSGTDDHINQLQSAEEWFKLTVGKKAWFEARFKVSDATLSDVYVGFATTDTSIVAGTTDSVGFRKLAGTTSLLSLTEDNTTETTNALATVADDTYLTLGFYYDGAGVVRFYKDRYLVSAHTANIETTNKLALTLMVQNGEGAAKTLTVDYVYACLER